MNKSASKADIVKHVMILDLASEFDISLFQANDTDYFCTCPSPNHKNANERTRSCLIYTNTNSFYCFGCCAGSNCLDFYILCAGVSFGEAIQALRERVPDDLVQEHEVEQNNFSILLDISTILRDVLNEHIDDELWISNLMKQVDESFFEIKQTDIDSAEKLLNKVKKTLAKRYGE